MPFVIALAVPFFAFMSWTLWFARFSKVATSDVDGHIQNILKVLPHNRRVECLRKGWLLRPVWLRLKRESVLTQHTVSEDKPGLIQVTAARRPQGQLAPFDNTVTMMEADGAEVRFLVDPLSDHYLVMPGEYCRVGMLPPCELEIRTLCWNILLLNTNAMQLTVADRIWNRPECFAYSDALSKLVDELKAAVQNGPMEKAAFLRVYSHWIENGPDIPERYLQGFLDILAPMHQWATCNGLIEKAS